MKLFFFPLPNFNVVTRLIVGAPKANQSFVSELNSPGTLFSCSLSKGGCHEVILEKFGNTEVVNRRIRPYDEYGFHDFKDEGWMGVAVDSRQADGLVVVCGHRWINQLGVEYLNEYLTNGLCYTMDKNFNQYSLKRLMPLIGRSKQVTDARVPYFAFGMAGIAAHFPKSQDLAPLIIGAPGVLQWDGSFINIPYPSMENPLAGASIDTPRDYRELDTKFSYFGYAVTSGKFQTDDAPVSYAIGSPRFKYFGKVYIIRIWTKGMEIKKRLYGQKQMGEYFGATVCGVDIDGDGLDDLLVGSPLYTSRIREEGLVYVFLNRKSNNFLEPILLAGSNIPGARFGMSISSIGQLNDDEYNDVVIGAPFEDENGAIYIYHGGPYGINPTFSQKIIAEEIGSNIRTFGASLSGGLDVDHNTFPEIAVGNYESDKVVLLFSQPPVKLHGNLYLKPSKINVRNPDCDHEGRKVRCFNATTCLSFTSNLPSLKIKCATTLALDTQSMYWKRVYMLVEGKNTTIHKTIIPITKSMTCTTFRIIVRDNVLDYLQPIAVNFSFILSPDNNKDIRYVPVLDPMSSTYVTEMAYFLRGCGKDDRCDSDLELDAWFLQPDNSKKKKVDLIMGRNTTLKIRTVVKNLGEPAYLTRLNVTIPKWSWFENTPSECKDTIRMQHTILICELGNPLEKEESLTLRLNIESMKESDFVLELQASTISNEKEMDRKNNFVKLLGSARTEADITIAGSLGSSDAEYISFHSLKSGEDRFVEFTHKYEIWNVGPSALEEVDLEIEIPIEDSKNKNKFLNITMVEQKNGRSGSYFGECKRSSDKSTSSDNGPVSITLPPPVKRRRKRSVPEADGKRSKLDCSNTECEIITCKIFNVKKQDPVFISIKMSVNLRILHNIKISEDIVDFYTRGMVTINKPPSFEQPRNHLPDVAKVKVSFDTGQFAMQELPDWIIPVSIIVGVLLFMLLMYGLYKIGFFRRKEKEKLESLLHSAEVETNEPLDEPQLNASQSHLISDDDNETVQQS